MEPSQMLNCQVNMFNIALAITLQHTSRVYISLDPIIWPSTQGFYLGGVSNITYIHLTEPPSPGK